MLQFNPEPYSRAYQQGQDRDQQAKQQVADSLSSIPQAFIAYSQQQATQKRQAMLDQLLQSKESREQREFDSNYGTPISPTSMFGVPTGQMGQSQYMPGGQPQQVGTGRSMVDAWNEWRAKGMPKEGAQAEFMPALAKDERKDFYENANPKPPPIFMTPYQQESLDLKKKEIGLKEGKAATEMADKKSKADAESMARNEKANLVIGKIDQALSKISGFNTGAGAFTKNIPGVAQMTGAKDLESDLETIKANLGFDQMAEMKAQSKAGATGLGALSEKEMQLLVSARASLEQAQTPEQLRNRLGEVKTHFQNWLKMEQGINPYGGNSGHTGQSQSSGTITQRNKRTGQVRTSNDGGKTWQISQ